MAPPCGNEEFDYLIRIGLKTDQKQRGDQADKYINSACGRWPYIDRFGQISRESPCQECSILARMARRLKQAQAEWH